MIKPGWHAFMDQLIAEIEPVSATQAMRFLLRWQGLEQAASPRDEQRKGPEALALVLEQLEGIEAPAGAWESTILPARLPDYAGQPTGQRQSRPTGGPG